MRSLFIILSCLVVITSCQKEGRIWPDRIKIEDIEVHENLLRSHQKNCDKFTSGPHFKGALDGEEFCIFDGIDDYEQYQQISSVFFTSGPEVGPNDSLSRYRLEWGFKRKFDPQNNVKKYAHAILISLEKTDNLSISGFIDKYIQVGDLKLKRAEIPFSYDPELLDGFVISYEWTKTGFTNRAVTSSIRLDPEEAYLRCTKLVKERTPEGYHYSMEFEMRCKLYFGLGSPYYFKTLDYGKMVVELDVPE
jgi:hypothetical protein